MPNFARAHLKAREAASGPLRTQALATEFLTISSLPETRTVPSNLCGQPTVSFLGAVSWLVEGNRPTVWCLLREACTYLYAQSLQYAAGRPVELHTKLSAQYGRLCLRPSARGETAAGRVHEQESFVVLR